jgi:hypothetical protein
LAAAQAAFASDSAATSYQGGKAVVHFAAGSDAFHHVDEGLAGAARR